MAFDVGFFDNGIFDGSVMSASQALQGAGQLLPGALSVSQAHSSLQGAGALALAIPLRLAVASAGIVGAGGLQAASSHVGQVVESLHGAGLLVAPFTMTAITRSAYIGAGSLAPSSLVVKFGAWLPMTGAGVLSEPVPLRLLVPAVAMAGAGVLAIALQWGLLPTYARASVEVWTEARAEVGLYTIATATENRGI